MPKPSYERNWPEEAEDRRGSVRFKINEVNALLESALFLDPIKLLNVGKLGFSALSKITYPPATPVSLHLDGFGPLAARVVWSSNEQLGARFVQPLPEGLLLNLLGVD
jgi:hypothetical protein